MTYESLLTHSSYLRTKASSQNAFGEWVYTWTTSTTTTPCRMSPITATERIEYPGRFEDVKYRGFFKAGASISINN